MRGQPAGPRTEHGRSDVFRCQSRSLCNSRQHARSDLFAVVEREYEVRVSVPRQCPMRPRRTLERPSRALQPGQHSPGARAASRAHATANVILAGSKGCCPASILSASTRNASVSACAMASARLFPYCIAPGISMTSAIHRPSSSASVSIVRRIVLFPGDRRAGYRTACGGYFKTSNAAQGVRTTPEDRETRPNVQHNTSDGRHGRRSARWNVAVNVTPPVSTATDSTRPGRAHRPRLRFRRTTPRTESRVRDAPRAS